MRNELPDMAFMTLLCLSSQRWLWPYGRAPSGQAKMAFIIDSSLPSATNLARALGVFSVSLLRLRKLATPNWTRASLFTSSKASKTNETSKRNILRKFEASISRRKLIRKSPKKRSNDESTLDWGRKCCKNDWMLSLTGVDRVTRGESGNGLRMSLKPKRKTFLIFSSYGSIHPGCPVSRFTLGDVMGFLAYTHPFSLLRPLRVFTWFDIITRVVYQLNMNLYWELQGLVSKVGEDFQLALDSKHQRLFPKGKLGLTERLLNVHFWYVHMRCSVVSGVFHCMIFPSSTYFPLQLDKI